MIFLHIQLIVPTDVGYQTPRSRAASKKFVTQKYLGSVFTTCTRTLLVGTTVPSGTASISTGRKPSCSFNRSIQPFRLNGTPCSRDKNSASSILSIVIGVVR